MAKPDADGFVPDDDDGFVPDKVAPGGLTGVITGAPKPNVSMAASAGRGALQGASLGFSDEVGGAIDSLLSRAAAAGDRTLARVGVGDHNLARGLERVNQAGGGSGGGLPLDDPSATYAQRRDALRSKNAEAQQAHPIAYGAGEVAGAVPTSVALGNLGGFLGGPASTALGGGQATLGRALGTGATLGAVGGAGTSTADTASGVARDAALGAGLGAVTGGLLHGAARGVSAAVGGAKERIAARAAANLEQGAKKPAYLGVRDESVDHVLAEHPTILRAAAARDDAAIVREAAPVLAKAQAELATIYGDAHADPKIAIGNMDKRIAALRKGTDSDDAAADKLQAIRDRFEKRMGTPAGARPAEGTAAATIADDERGWFHSGYEPIADGTQKEGISLAPSPQESIQYIKNHGGDSGHITKFTIDSDANIADFEEAKAVAEELGINTDGEFEHDIIDNPRVRAQLKENGWDAIKFQDQGPAHSGNRMHQTLRVLQPDVIHVQKAAPVIDGKITAPAPLNVVPATGRGGVITPQDLRAEQTDFQRNSYGKAKAGDLEASANLKANAEASKAIGDAVFQHVLGTDFAGARRLAAADPNSIAARLLRANQTINGLNRIEATVKGRADARAQVPGLIGAVAHAVKHPMDTAVDHAALPVANAVDRGLSRVARPADLLARTLAAAKAGNPWAAKTIQALAATPSGAARIASMQAPGLAADITSIPAAQAAQQ